ncbi:MAG: MBL fold metallo-hydrolase [Flavobacteriales bacterium]
MVNTYVLHDETGACVLIDPGCLSAVEKASLRQYTEENELQPAMLLNTHTHIDHIFGNRFAFDTFGLKPLVHKEELPILKAASSTAAMFGISDFEPSPEPDEFLAQGDTVAFGNSVLDVLHLPGHSPGHLAFVCREQQFVLQGDVLFLGSIGRTDLPGGDFDTLLHSIRTQLFPLGDDYSVFCGHGEATTIGYEKKHNPFLLDYPG